MYGVGRRTFHSVSSNAQGQQPHRNVTEVSMKNIVELVLLVIALAGAIGGVWNNRFKLGKGIGLRFIQYLGLTVLVPIIVILSLEGGETLSMQVAKCHRPRDVLNQGYFFHDLGGAGRSVHFSQAPLGTTGPNR